MRRFFRIVANVPPTLDDFASNLARSGRAPDRLPLAVRALWDGVSVHDSIGDSRRQATELPRLGIAIAELAIPDGAGVRIERTVPRNRGHHTLWASPGLLLGSSWRRTAWRMSAMTRAIELWDQTTGNLLGDFPDDAAAADTLRQFVAAFGRDFADSVAVIRRGPDGRGESGGSGADLLHRHDHPYSVSAD